MVQGFDVFLSYNSRDRAAVVRLAGLLEDRGLRPWLDEKYVPPGRSFVQELDAAIRSSRSVAVLIGKDGLGPWQNPEIEAFLTGAVQRSRPGIPVIPVFLPEAPEDPRIPVFLSVRSWVDLRAGFSEDGLDRLVWGIKGSKPDPGSPLPSPELPGLRNLPFESLDNLFKGRDGQLVWLASELLQEVTAKRVVIRGLGGVGKTRLAVEYALRYGARYIALLFVRADSPEILQSQIASLAGPDLLNLSEWHAKELEAVGAVKRWFREHPGWFLILDGIDTQEVAKAVGVLLPSLVGGHVLMTSRVLGWPPNVRECEIFAIPQDQAVQFLLDRTAGRREARVDDAERAVELAMILDTLPLALEQAAAYIAHNQMTLAEYLEAWQTERQKVLEWYDERASQYSASIAVTWKKSFQQLGSVAGGLLRLMAYLAPESIPISMLIEGSRVVGESAALLCEETGQELSREPVKSALTDLATYSLVMRQGTELSINRMVQEVLQTWIPEERRRAWIELALRLVDGFLPREKEGLGTWAGWDLLRPHAAQVLDYADRSGIVDSTAKLRNNLGRLLRARGLSAEAEVLCGREPLEEMVSIAAEQAYQPRRETTAERLALGVAQFDFSLRIESQRDEKYEVFVIGSPAGEGRSFLRLPLGGIGGLLDNVVDLLSESKAAQGVEARRAAERAGDLLFHALFGGEVLHLLEASVGYMGVEEGRSLRVSLHLDTSHPELTLLNSLPWELLYWQERREYLSLGRRSPFVRSLDIPRPARPFRLDSSLRVLIVTAQPAGVAPLAVEHECRLIEHALHDVPGIQVTVLHHATAERLRRALLVETFHVLHFVGHGVFDRESGEGSLLFEDSAGRMNPLPGSIVADILRDFAALRLVFLNTCGGALTGRNAGVDPFSGVATALVMAGLSAVLAMQFDISDRAAIAFSEAFYRRLSAGDPIDLATVEGRLAIRLRDPAGLEWATPVLYLQGTNGALFTVQEPAPAVKVSAEVRRHILDFSSFIADKTAGFVGRRQLFEAVEQFTRDSPRGYFVLRGDPGIGKSTFVAEMVRRGRYPHHFNIRAAGIQRSEQFLSNMCAQLIEAYSLDHAFLPPEAAQDGRFLSALLGEVSAKLASGEKAILLVDALDEADAAALAPGANPLYLPVTLPLGVYIVATTQRRSFGIRIDCEQRVFDLEQDSVANLADVRALIESKLSLPGINAFMQAQKIDAATFVEEMLAKSQGNFMYLHYLLPEIERGTYWDRGFDRLPFGLLDFYEGHWQQMRAKDEDAWLNYQIPVLVALVVAGEPISLELISAFSGIANHSRIRAVLQGWDAFLYAQDVDEEGVRQRRYRLFHTSFSDFIAAKDEIVGERVDLRAAHLRMADALWRELDKSS
jgi:hypothetical protein